MQPQPAALSPVLQLLLPEVASSWLSPVLLQGPHQPPRSAAVRGLSTKFVAAVDESSLVFGFPGALGGSDGDGSGAGDTASGGPAQQKASSPPPASVK